MPRFKIENIPLAVQRGIKFRILADEREKIPWTFARYWQRAPFDYCNKHRLLTSDYSIEGGQHYIALERKSAVDLLSTLSLGLDVNGIRKRDRFELELGRMQADVQNCYVIVEAPLSRILQAGASWKGQLAKSLLSGKIAIVKELVHFLGNKGQGRIHGLSYFCVTCRIRLHHIPYEVLVKG